MKSTSSWTRPPRKVDAGTPSPLPSASQHADSIPLRIWSEKCGTTRQRPLRQRSPKIASMSPGERPTNARAISSPYDSTAAGSSQIDSPYPVTPSSVSTAKRTRFTPSCTPER